MIYWKDIKTSQNVRDDGQTYRVGNEIVYWNGNEALKAQRFLSKKTKDMDLDGVPNYNDCEPANPKKQDLVSSFALGAGASFVGSRASAYYDKKKRMAKKSSYWD